MAKFATPVAMKVTEEQEEYLREELKKLGYSEFIIGKSEYIATNWMSIHSQFAVGISKPTQRFIIEEYNPELFLAIAAMTEDEIPIIGEWLKYKGSNEMFRVNGYGNINNYTIGRINKDNPTGSGNFLKATLEELTNHFSKPKETFVLPEKWKLEVTEENVDAVNKWKTSLGYPSTLSPRDCVTQLGLWINMSMPSASEIITTEQFMEHVYNPAFNEEIPDEFYVKYCEGFTEDIFNELRLWSAENVGTGVEADVFLGYDEFIRQDRTRYFLFEKGCPDDDWSFGVDASMWGGVKTEYTLEQVKKLINYKPKTNNDEYKENNCKKELRENERGNDGSSSTEREQVNEDLDRNSSSERGKEIKARVKRSRNLCERGSFSSSEKVASTRRTSFRVRAEKGDFNF